MDGLRVRGGPSPELQVGTRDLSAPPHGPLPLPQPHCPDRVKALQAHGESLCASTVSSRATDGGDKLMPPFGGEEYQRLGLRRGRREAYITRENIRGTKG